MERPRENAGPLLLSGAGGCFQMSADCQGTGSGAPLARGYGGNRKGTREEKRMLTKTQLLVLGMIALNGLMLLARGF